MRILLTIRSRRGAVLFEDLDGRGAIAVPHRGDFFEAAGRLYQIGDVRWKPEVDLMHVVATAAPFTMYGLEDP